MVNPKMADHLRRAVTLFCFAILSSYLITAPLRGTHFSTIAHATMVLVLLSVFLITVVKQQFKFSVPTLLTIGSLVCLLATAIALNPLHPLSEWSDFEVFYRIGLPVILFSLPTIVFREQLFLKRLMSVHLLTSVCIGVLIILVGFGFFTPQYRHVVGTRIDHLEGIFSISTYPLHSTPLFGVYMVPAVTITWAWIDDLDSSLWAGILSVASAFLITVIFLVQSRKVWLAILFAGFIYYYLHPRYRSVVITASVLSPPLALIGIGTAYVTGFGVNSLLTRLDQFSVAIPFLFDNPLGRGFSAFRYLTRFDLPPHNYLLAAAVDYGFLALLFLIVASVLIVIRLFRAGYKLPDPFVRAGAAAVVGMFVVLLFDPHYELQRLWLIAGVFLAYTDLVLSDHSDVEGK